MQISKCVSSNGRGKKKVGWDDRQANYINSFANRPRGSRKCQIESSRETPQVIPSQRSYVSSESPYALERSTSLPGRYGHTPDSGMSMHAPSVNDYAQTIQDVAYSISSPHDSSISSITTNTTTTKKRRLSRSSLTGGDESFKRSLHNGDGSTTSPAATTSSMVELQLPIADYSEFLMEELEEPIKRDDPQAREWHADPYEVDPERTIHYIESYFTHMNDSQYALLPREPFLRWLTAPDHGHGQPPKSLEDKMLLYWMMTMGCMFSVRPDRLLAMKRFSRVARYAVEHTAGGLTLQLAQCRIIMSFWYLAMGAVDKSWDAIGAAVRTAFGLGYNVESNITVHESREDCEYGLLPPALMECRRRTFWIAFLFDVCPFPFPSKRERERETNGSAFLESLLPCSFVDFSTDGVCALTMSRRSIRSPAIGHGAVFPGVPEQIPIDDRGYCGTEPHVVPD